jgi:hypothetical protein
MGHSDGKAIRTGYWMWNATSCFSIVVEFFAAAKDGTQHGVVPSRPLHSQRDACHPNHNVGRARSRDEQGSWEGGATRIPQRVCPLFGSERRRRRATKSWGELWPCPIAGQMGMKGTDGHHVRSNRGRGRGPATRVLLTEPVHRTAGHRFR